MLVTIFTPTYNRASFLPILYRSLDKQSCKCFEWIIVDDGSMDNTWQVMDEIIKNHKADFNIRYFHKENGGKHTAINKGVAEAAGDLFLILDSDDSLPVNSISIIVDKFKDVMNDPTIGGVSGLIAHHNGELIGSGYPEDCIIASSIEMRYKYGVTGDLIEVFKTCVLREFKFPEIKGERFCPEALLWNRIAQKYKLKCFNKVVYYRDYLDGGLTDNIVKIRMKSPIASTMCYAEMNGFDIPFIAKLKTAINYWRFRYCVTGTNAIPSIGFCWNLVATPIGYLMHIRDLKKIKQ